MKRKQAHMLLSKLKNKIKNLIGAGPRRKVLLVLLGTDG